MKNKRIAIITGVVVLIIGIIATVTIVKGKSVNEEITENKTEPYEIKQEFEQEPINVENIKMDKEFKVGEIEQKEDKVTVNMEVDIDNAKEAYEFGTVLKGSFNELNKEKISGNDVEIILVGKDKTWLIDGTESVKEIEIN